jgi:hypothetical protein
MHGGNLKLVVLSICISILVTLYLSLKSICLNIHRDTEHCLSVSVSKFFSVPFSSNCFRREVIVHHGGHDLNILLTYELELCTNIICSLVFEILELQTIYLGSDVWH